MSHISTPRVLVFLHDSIRSKCPPPTNLSEFFPPAAGMGKLPSISLISVNLPRMEQLVHLSFLYSDFDENSKTVSMLQKALSQKWIPQYQKSLHAHFPNCAITMESICQLRTPDLRFAELQEDAKETPRRATSTSQLPASSWTESEENLKTSIDAVVDSLFQRKLQKKQHSSARLQKKGSTASKISSSRSIKKDGSSSNRSTSSINRKSTSQLSLKTPINREGLRKALSNTVTLLEHLIKNQQYVRTIEYAQYAHSIRQELQSQSLHHYFDLKRFLKGIEVSETDSKVKEILKKDPKTTKEAQKDALWEYRANQYLAQAYLELYKLPKALLYINRNRTLSKELNYPTVRKFSALQLLLRYYSIRNNESKCIAILDKSSKLLEKIEKDTDNLLPTEEAIKEDPLLELDLEAEQAALQLQRATSHQNMGNTAQAKDILTELYSKLKSSKSKHAKLKRLRSDVAAQLKMFQELDGLSIFKVTLVKGCKLKAADLSGYSDPYVVLTVNNAQRRTSSVKNQTLNPEWNEDFLFKVDPKKDVLKLRVIDEDKFTSHDKLGAAVVEFSKYKWKLGEAQEVSAKLSLQGDIILNIEPLKVEEEESGKE